MQDAAYLLALAPMFAWGFADYLAGSRGRSVPAVDSVTWSQSVSAVLILAVALFGGEGSLMAGGLPAALGGAAGVAGLVCFYRAMQMAAVALVAPIVASGVGLPVLYGLVVGGGINTPSAIGIGIGVGAICCFSAASKDIERSRSPHTETSALLLAAAGALGYGCFLIGLGASSSGSPFDATVAARVGAILVAVPVVAARTVRAGGRRDALPPPTFICSLALLDALGVLAFAAAAAANGASLAVVSVLASLYPAVTVGLSVRTGKEVLTGRQVLGVALTLLAIPLLALGAAASS